MMWEAFVKSQDINFRARFPFKRGDYVVMIFSYYNWKANVLVCTFLAIKATMLAPLMW